eukprot:1596658-Pyramimonas_sp.AAC.1
MVDPPFHPYRVGDYSGVASEATPIRIRRPTVFALHVFSGQRRRGDLQWQLENQIVLPCVEVLMLSIDIAIDPIRGDLAREGAILEWAEHMRA